MIVATLLGYFAKGETKLPQKTQVNNLKLHKQIQQSSAPRTKRHVTQFEYLTSSPNNSCKRSTSLSYTRC